MKQAFTTHMDKVNYLKGLIRLSKSDGQIDPSEKAYFDYAVGSMQLPEEDIQTLNILWENDEMPTMKFSTRYDAVFFLQEAVQICAIDGNYDETEHKDLRKMAEELRVAETDLEKIESWVMQGIAWRQQGEALVSEICERSES